MSFSVEVRRRVHSRDHEEQHRVRLHFVRLHDGGKKGWVGVVEGDLLSRTRCHLLHQSARLGCSGRLGHEQSDRLVATESGRQVDHGLCLGSLRRSPKQRTAQESSIPDDKRMRHMLISSLPLIVYVVTEFAPRRRS